MLKLFKTSLTITLIVFSLSAQTMAQTHSANFPKPKQGNTYVIAHRGAHNGIPENSLAAYQKAIDLGCDFIEIDTRLTKDKVIVSVHNPKIDAYVAGRGGNVGDYTLAELKTMDIGAGVGEEWEGTQIPSLEEILELCRGKIGIYIDLKEPLVPEVLSLLQKYQMEGNAVWYIHHLRMKQIKKVNKSCDKCYVMPDPGKEKNIKKVVRKAKPVVLATDMSKLNDQFVKTAHKYNVKVFTDDDAGNVEEWKKILEWGTDGIQTNHPEKLIQYLKKISN